MNKRLAFAFDADRCSGCMACVVACQDQNDWKAGGAVLRTVTCREEGPYPARVAWMSMACMHCEDAPCLTACPETAITRRDGSGIVDVDRGRCVGCRSCEAACPFGAPQFADDGTMVKCDFCHLRVEHGLEPACVHTCTTGALTFGTPEELAARKSRNPALEITTPLHAGS